MGTHIASIMRGGYRFIPTPHPYTASVWEVRQEVYLGLRGWELRMWYGPFDSQAEADAYAQKQASFFAEHDIKELLVS